MSKRRINTTITPLLIVLPMALFFSLFHALHYFFNTSPAGMGLAPVLLFSLSLGLGAALIIERVLVGKQNISIRKIWFIELALLAVFFGFYYYKKASFYYKVSDETKWFAVLLTDDVTKQKPVYAFPFNRQVQIDSSQVVIINKKDIGNKRKIVKPSGYKWLGYSWQSKKITINKQVFYLDIYSRPRSPLTVTDYANMRSALLKQLPD